MKSISSGLNTHINQEVTTPIGRKTAAYRRDPEHGRALCKATRDRRKAKGLPAYSTEDYRKNKASIQKHRRERNAALRRQVIEHYGARCKCCGESQYEFLSVDHVKGGGRRQHKELGNTFEIYRWIIKNGYPDTIQILCYNCNMSKGLYGKCPHEEGK